MMHIRLLIWIGKNFSFSSAALAASLAANAWYYFRLAECWVVWVLT